MPNGGIYHDSTRQISISITGLDETRAVVCFHKEVSLGLHCTLVTYELTSGEWGVQRNFTASTSADHPYGRDMARITSSEDGSPRFIICWQEEYGEKNIGCSLFVVSGSEMVET